MLPSVFRLGEDDNTITTSSAEEEGKAAEHTVSPAEYTVVAARITGAHGVSGNVRLRLIGTNPEVSASAIRSATRVLAVDDDGSSRIITVTSLRKQPQPKGSWIARFQGVAGRDDAEALFGMRLMVPESCLPSLPEGEYYVDQLLGMSVRTEDGRPLGELTDVLNSPANDVYVTSTGVMIPAVAAFVQSVDVERRTITVVDMAGLLDEA
ncbi:MAG: ribosome maturation factor RimM [Capsulimonadaceae bacterium]